MSILKLANMGHPILRQKASSIKADEIGNYADLIKDMIETMQDASGTGLAAPQVHQSVRIVTYFVKSGRGQFPCEVDIPLTILINPQITMLGDEVVYDWEGCLSVPGLTGLVPRSKNIRLNYMTIEGGEISVELSGFHARVVQHECDHLDGVLYPERMDDLSLLMYSDEMKHGIPAKAQKLLDKQKI